MRSSVLILAVLGAPVLGIVASANAQTPEPPLPSPSAIPTPPPVAELRGRIQIRGRDGGLTPGAGTVVWIPGVAPDAAATNAVIESREKRFNPHVVAVSKGAKVTFPNVDRIFHNVFSVSTGNKFDLGLYRKGAARSWLMKSPGLVRVYCNIHPDMAAYVMVLDGALFAVVGENGAYRIRDIPPGRRRVLIWNEKGGEQEFQVDLPADGRRTLDATLDSSAYRRIAHKNKHGKDYPPVRADDDRY